MALEGLQPTGVALVVDGFDNFARQMDSASGKVKYFGGALKLLDVAQEAGNKVSGLGLALMALNPPIGLAVTGLGLVIKLLGTGGKVIVSFASAIINSLVWAFKKLYGIIRPLIDAIFNLVRSVLNAINPFRMLGDFIGRVAYVAVGILTALVLRKLARGLGDMAKMAFEAASFFQLLKIRMEGLYARDIMSGMEKVARKPKDFADALTLAVGPVKEIFAWITRLAIISPFTITDIASAYTLAKAYGIVEERAKRLVEAAANFAAGMGLDSEAIMRVVMNLGQMLQQGKITGTELRDLARGAFVPLSDVFEEMGRQAGYSAQEMRNMSKVAQPEIFAEMALQMGVSTDELIRLGEKGLVPVTVFMEAFIAVVERDFPGAMKRAARTILGVTSNLKELIQTILGFKILGPPLAVITDKLATFLETLVADPRLLDAAESLGNFLAELVKVIWPPTLTAESIVKTLEALFNILGLLIKLRITKDFLDFLLTLKDMGVPGWVTDSIVRINNALFIFWNFIDEIKDDFAAAIGRIAAALGFEGFTFPTAVGDITQWLEDFALWLYDNKDKIITAMESISGVIEHFFLVTLPLLLTGAPAVPPPPSMETAMEKMAELITDPLKLKAAAAPPTFTALDKLALWVNTEGVKVLDFFKNLGEQPGWAALGRSLNSIAVSLKKIAEIVGGPDGDTIIAFFNFLGWVLAFIAAAFATLLRYFTLLLIELDKIQTKVQLIWSEFTIGWEELTTKMRQIGVDIVKGLLDGIKSEWGNLTAWITTKINALLDLLATLTGTESPSKKMMRLGRDLMRGLEKGIADNLRLPEVQMTLAASRLTGGAHTVPSPVHNIASTHYSTTTNNVSNVSLWFPQFALAGSQSLAEFLRQSGQMAGV